MNRFVFFSIVIGGLTCVAPASANKALAEKNGCLSCHAVNEKIMGPAYAEVAKKYAGVSDAKNVVALNILKGGAGKWGDIPMPAQTQLSKTDAAKLADWILKGAN
jgi:cytochrome c